MTRETGRMAAMAKASALPVNEADAGSLFDPVEKRIDAITRAVDQIASALAIDGSLPEARQHREDMMRHLAHDLRSPLLSCARWRPACQQATGGLKTSPCSTASTNAPGAHWICPNSFS